MYNSDYYIDNIWKRKEMSIGYSFVNWCDVNFYFDFEVIIDCWWNVSDLFILLLVVRNDCFVYCIVYIL